MREMYFHLMESWKAGKRGLCTWAPLSFGDQRERERETCDKWDGNRGRERETRLTEKERDRSCQEFHFSFSILFSNLLRCHLPSHYRQPIVYQSSRVLLLVMFIFTLPYGPFFLLAHFVHSLTFLLETLERCGLHALAGLRIRERGAEDCSMSKYGSLVKS